jgi:hypothetical protein
MVSDPLAVQESRSNTSRLQDVSRDKGDSDQPGVKNDWPVTILRVANGWPWKLIWRRAGMWAVTHWLRLKFLQSLVGPLAPEPAKPVGRESIISQLGARNLSLTADLYTKALTIYDGGLSVGPITKQDEHTNKLSRNEAARFAAFSTASIFAALSAVC